jgi:uridine kinase
MSKEPVYESKAIPKQFGGASRASVKIKDSFYTFEASLQKEFPAGINMDEVDMEQEWKLLYEELNSLVDDQIDEIQSAYQTASK